MRLPATLEPGTSLRNLFLQSGKDQSGLLQVQRIWLGQTMILMEIGMRVQWDMLKDGHMIQPCISRSGQSQLIPRMDSSGRNTQVVKSGRIHIRRQANGSQGWQPRSISPVQQETPPKQVLHVSTWAVLTSLKTQWETGMLGIPAIRMPSR